MHKTVDIYRRHLTLNKPLCHHILLRSHECDMKHVNVAKEMCVYGDYK